MKKLKMWMTLPAQIAVGFVLAQAIPKIVAFAANLIMQIEHILFGLVI